MVYIVKFSKKFKKDFKLALKQHKDIKKFYYVLDLLVNSKLLDSKFKNHQLTGNLKGYYECHIEPDWLLVYYIENDKLVLVALGSHSYLLDK